MKYFINYGDQIGNVIGLKIDGSHIYKSLSGSILSMLLALFSIGATISFGLEILEKNNAKVTLNNGYLGLPQINLTNQFPLAVNIVRRGAFPLDNFRSYYNISLVNYNLKKVNGTAIVRLTEREMRICKEEDFKGRKAQFESVANPTDPSLYFCLRQDQPLEIYGQIGTSAVNYLAVLINRCVNGTDVICKSPAEIDVQFKNVFIQFITTDYYFDSKNFTDPGQVYFKSTNIPITSDFYKRAYMYYSNVDYNTDDGLIFESKVSQSYYKVDNYKEQIFFSKDAAFTPNTLAEISITITPLKYEFFRSYYKLQQLAADVGGIIKSFTLLFTFLNKILNEKFLDLKIINDIFNVNMGGNNLGRKSIRNEISKNSYSVKIKDTGITSTEENLGKFASNRSLKIKKLVVTPKKKVTIEAKVKLKIFLSDFICFLKGRNKKLSKFSEMVINNSLDIRRVIKSVNEIEIIRNVLLDNEQKMATLYLLENKCLIGPQKYHLNTDYFDFQKKGNSIDKRIFEMFKDKSSNVDQLI
jgi:hypothetical protein